MSRSLTIAALVLLGAAGRVSAQAVDEFVNKRIASVRMQLEGQDLQDPALMALVETKVGDPLHMADVRETLAHLHGLGRFQDVEVHATLTPEPAVDLLYALVPIHTVRRVMFRGQPGVGEGDLATFVRERFGSSPPVGRAAEAARALTVMLNDRGFLNARVTPQTEVEHAPERTTLIFTVEAGPRARIGRLIVAGTEPPGESIRARAALRRGRPLDRVAIAADLDKYVDELKSRGYYQARADHSVHPSETPDMPDVEVSIDAGPRIQLVFRGDPLPAKLHDELVPIEKEGSVDEDLLEDSRSRIETYLRAEGYRDAKAPYEWTGDEQQRQLVFTVTRGAQYEFADYEITGNTAIDTRELALMLTMKRGEPYVEATLMADLAKIGEEYRRRGYKDVKIDPVPTQGADGGPVPSRRIALSVNVVIVEGPQTRVRNVTFTGENAFSAEQLLTHVALKPGQPYYEPQVRIDNDAVLLRYLNNGFPQAAVTPAIVYSDDKTRVDLAFKIEEGIQVFVDHVLVVGNVRTTVKMIEDEISVRPGQPLRLSDVNDSQDRLAALGLFRRIRLNDVAHAGDPTRRDVVISVEEAPLTTYGYGGGVEGGRQLRSSSDSDAQGQAEAVFQIAPRGFFEIGRRNLWGKNRTVNLFTRVTLRPRNATTSRDPTTPQGGYGFNEYRVLGTLREPKIGGTATDALFTAFTEQAIRSSFNFARSAVQAEVARRVRPELTLLGRYSLERTKIFDRRYDESEQPQIDRYFPQVRLSSLSSAIVRDTRDEPLDPSRGLFVSLENKVAARALGSEVGFVRSFLQTFTYRRLPTVQRMMFASAVRVGIATGFDRTVIGEDGQPVTVSDIPASERFFAGGATTVRGFALDQLGTPAVIDSNGFSRGGDALLILNAELRMDLPKARGQATQLAVFLDAGNVFAHPRDIRFADIRPTPGFGIRWKSPLGPFRADIGFNPDRRFVNGRREEGFAYHITLGQAF